MPEAPQAPSMLPTFLLLGLFAAAAGVVLWWQRQRTAKHLVKAGQSQRHFFEQTGFRVVGAERADLDQQVELAMKAMYQSGGDVGQEWVRDCGGVEVRHFFRRVTKLNQEYHWCRWSSSFSRPPRVGLQVVDKRLVGKLAGLDNFIESRSYEWRQLFPHQVQLPDAELAKRFLVFGTEPALVVTALQANGVRDALLACKQVDLSVDADGVVFSDPFRDNITAALGGGVGIVMMGADPHAMMQMILPVHDRLSWLAASLARACA